MSEEKKELIFVDGFRFFKPNEKAPKSIKGNIVIELPVLREFIKKNGIGGKLRIDLRKSETKGTYYTTLNTFNPTPKEPSEAQKDDLRDF